jgi:hypothetical protein
MPKQLTSKQIANIQDRSTKRMLIHGRIASAVNRAQVAYENVPAGAKSRKPLPPTANKLWLQRRYENLRGEIIELPDKMPKSKASELRREVKSLRTAFNTLSLKTKNLDKYLESEVPGYKKAKKEKELDDLINSKSKKETIASFNRFLKRHGITKDLKAADNVEQWLWARAWKEDIRKHGWS